MKKNNIDLLNENWEILLENNLDTAYATFHDKMSDILDINAP